MPKNSALRTGLLLLPTYEPARLAALAELAESTGYDSLWLADERFFREVYACLTLCALRTRRIHLGPCVTDPYSRYPALTAMAIATLDEISNRRHGRSPRTFAAVRILRKPRRPWEDRTHVKGHPD